MVEKKEEDNQQEEIKEPDSESLENEEVLLENAQVIVGPTSLTVFIEAPLPSTQYRS